MPQHRMEFDEVNRDEASTYSSGYEESPHHHNYSFSYGQKLSGQTGSRAASAGQRLTLAIVSLIFLLFLIIIGIAVAADNLNSPGANIVLPIFLIMFVFFFTAVIVINALFNRRW